MLLWFFCVYAFLWSMITHASSVACSYSFERFVFFFFFGADAIFVYRPSTSCKWTRACTCRLKGQRGQAAMSAGHPRPFEYNLLGINTNPASLWLTSNPQHSCQDISILIFDHPDRLHARSFSVSLHSQPFTPSPPLLSHLLFHPCHLFFPAPRCTSCSHLETPPDHQEPASTPPVSASMCT